MNEVLVNDTDFVIPISSTLNMKKDIIRLLTTKD